MKITFISDTHTAQPELSGGDLLIHAGDLTYHGKTKETKKQLDWLAKADYDKIIIVPGNHEVQWEEGTTHFRKHCADRNIVCLVEEGLEYEGIKIFGSPITPEFCGWAYMKRPNEIAQHWERIPLDTDILITHGPPRGILDKNLEGQPCGCPALRKKVAEVNPKIHVFGHIHEAYGEHEEDETLFINAAIMDRRYHPVHAPVNVKWRG